MRLNSYSLHFRAFHLVTGPLASVSSECSRQTVESFGIVIWGLLEFVAFLTRVIQSIGVFSIPSALRPFGLGVTGLKLATRVN